MTGRERLFNRRASTTFNFEVTSLRYTASLSCFPNGRVAKIFLSNTKPSSQSDANARDAAVAASLALQHGCPLETLRRAVVRDENGKASTPLNAAIELIAVDRGAQS